MLRVPTPDLTRAVLRTLVPLSFAGGFVGIYPAIAPEVVARFGKGFEPPFVAVDVLLLVTLFLIDSFARDRRLARTRAAAMAAEERARESKLRAAESRFLLDVTADLHESDRLEIALVRVLERLNGVVPFTAASVHLKEERADAPGATVVRAIFPLTATLGRGVVELARATLASGAPAHDADADALSCPLRPPEPVGAAARGPIGAIVLEGVADPRESDVERLRAVADRIATAVHGLGLVTKLESKERSLRHAWQELRRSSQSLARSSADSEAATVGRAASIAFHEPVQQALAELRRLERAAPASSAVGAEVRPGLAKLKRLLIVVREGLSEMRRLHPAPRAVEPIDVNDAVVAALDLVTPDFRRAGIDVRLSLANDLPQARVDEGQLARLLNRLFRRCRAHLRNGPPPKRLTVATEPFGASVRIRIHDNGAGLRPPHRARGDERRAGASSPFARALRKAERAVFREELEAHGITLKARAEVGHGHRYSVRIKAVHPAVAREDADAAGAATTAESPAGMIRGPTKP